MWDVLTAAELEWKATCRRFAEEVIAPKVRTFDEENRFPAEVHAAAYEAGIMNVGFPVALGGKGLSHRALVVGSEELAAVCSPTAFTLGFNHGALQPVLQAGTTDQKERLVGELLRRRGYASLCLSEPARSGSHLPDVGTRAVRGPGGFAVSGTKCMVGNGTESSLYLVLARAVMDGRDAGLTFFAVPRTEAVHVGPNTDKLGFRCVPTPTVVFDGAQVPEENVIGGVGQAEDVLRRCLDYVRFGGASVILGIVVGALRELPAWLDSRKTWPDEPLGEKSHVKLLLGELFTEVRATRLLLWRAAELLDKGLPCGTETSMAKLYASRLAVRATNELVQLYGWRGIDAG